VKMTMTFELTGNRKSKTKVKDEMDNVDSEWMVDDRQPINKTTYREKKDNDQLLNQM
jgi:hypothetical protein